MPLGIGLGIRLPLVAQPRTVGGAGLVPPVNSVAPVVSGTPTDGQVLSCTTGTWSGSPTFSYQWKSGVTNVGTNANTYTLVTDDVGSNITCVVTATNAGGSNNATSNSLGPVVSAVTFNPADKGTGIVLSGGNLTATAIVAGGGVRSTNSKSTGRWHVEMTPSNTSGVCVFALKDSAYAVTSTARNGPGVSLEFATGNIRVNGSFGGSTFGFDLVGTPVAMEGDSDTAEVWFKVGGLRLGPFSSAGLTGAGFVVYSGDTPPSSATVNFGASAFAITPTSGFSAWG